MTDWQVGDLALCVDASPCWCCGPAGVELNVVYRVTEVLRHPQRAQLGLLLDGASPGDHPGFGASRFRKIRPDEQEACEPEFVTLLKRSKVTA